MGYGDEGDFEVSEIKHQPVREVMSTLKTFGLEKSKTAVFKFVLADSSVECELETIRKDEDGNLVFLIRPSQTLVPVVWVKK